MFSCMYIAPGQEQTTPWWQLWRQQKAQITLTICCKFQNDLFEFWFYTHFLIILYMYIAPGQGQTNPWGQNFDVNRKLLPLRPFVASFKKISLNSDFIHIFYVFPHVYSHRAGADNPLWTKFWCQQKGLVTLPICCKFQENIFEVWFYTHFLFLYMYIAPGQGQTTPWGQMLMSTESAYHFAHLLWVLNNLNMFFLYFSTCI